jgi:hypothetical protein
MEINISKAINLFFPNPSLEMIYIEAVANAIDAGADYIKINIELDSFDKYETLKINIEDNGEGFNDKNFSRFSKLLETETKDHKGSGRLIFLHYFNDIEIESYYEKHLRKFSFTDKFNGDCVVSNTTVSLQKTILSFKGYTKQKIYTYNYITPTTIKQTLLTKFYPLFYALKKEDKKLQISIEINIKETENKIFEKDFSPALLDIAKLPNLESTSLIDKSLIFGNEFEVFYSIEPKTVDNLMITAICVDGRVVEENIIERKNIPSNYDVVFLLFSDSLQGKSDPARSKLEIDDEQKLKHIRLLFRNKIAEVLNDKIPSIRERNVQTHETLLQKYPHLQGYFQPKIVGLIDKEETLDEAQNKFFKDQKKILEADEMTEEQYKKSLEISSRLLTEYILYRNIIINKLKETNHNNSEADIHKIIVPMKKIYQKNTFIDDIYWNNAWLLDDKYMSYSTILSDIEMDKLLSNIAIDDYQKDDSRPDIALVFSREPKEEAKADVVIVELKKIGLKDLKRKNDIHIQLLQRATQLLNYYPNKIQRIWFYGIVDIDEQFEMILKTQGYRELFSNGALFYQEADVFIEKNKSVLASFYIQSFESFIKDAESRNATFLQILKEGLKVKSDVFI